MSWLINSVSPQIASSVLYASSARELWTDICDRYRQKNGPTLFQLKRAIHELKQEGMDVTTYYAKLKGIWDEFQGYDPIPICECGALKKCKCGLIQAWQKSRERDRVMTFLMGLGDQYMLVRDQIMQMEPPATIKVALAKVLQQEKQIVITRPHDSSTSVIDTAAMFNKSESKTAFRNQKRERPFCTHCNKLVHTVDKCFKIYGYPPGYGNKGKKQQSANQVSVDAMVGKMEGGDPAQFTPNQCQQLLAYLSSQLATQSLNMGSQPAISTEPNPTSHLASLTLAGPQKLADDWDGD